MQHPCTSMEEPFMEPKWIQKTMNSLSTAKEKTTQQSSVMSHYQEQQLDFTAECQVWRKKQEGEVRATKKFQFYFCGPPCWTKEAAKALVKRAAYRHYCPCPHTRLEESCRGGWPYLLGCAPASAQGKTKKLATCLRHPLAATSRRHVYPGFLGCAHASAGIPEYATRGFASVLATGRHCQHSTHDLVSAHSEPGQGTVACLHFLFPSFAGEQGPSSFDTNKEI